MDRMDHLRGDADVARIGRERVEGDRDAALERVLDRDDGAVGVALLHGHDGVVDRRIGHRLDVGRRGGAQGLVAVRPAGPRKATLKSPRATLP